MITFTIDIKIHTDPHNNPTTRVLLLPAVAVWLLLLHLVPPTHRVIPDKYNLRSYQVQTFKPQHPSIRIKIHKLIAEEKTKSSR